jgi:hypothetical protein
MKNLILLSFSMVFSLSVWSQVVQETQVMSKGSQPALTLVIPESTVEFVVSEWKDYTKNYGKGTKVKGSKESMIEGAHVLDIAGADKINIYAFAEAANNGTKAVIWMEIAGGFLNPGDFPKEYRGAVKFVEDFGHKVEVDQVSADLEAQQKVLTKYQSNLTKLQHENDNLNKTIEDAKLKITEAETNITANKEAQANAQKEIDAQKALMDQIQKKLDTKKAKKPN